MDTYRVWLERAPVDACHPTVRYHEKLLTVIWHWITPFLTIWNVLLVLLHHHTSVCLKMYRIPLLKTLHTQASRNILEEWKSSEVKWLAIATLISVSKHTHTFSPSHTHTQPREHSGECSHVAMGTRSPPMPLCHVHAHREGPCVPLPGQLV